jgi:D-beta-D-heptose 7-phosphate kinase/D-beta-D-heptose 1-phosphate adenosyltransferase
MTETDLAAILECLGDSTVLCVGDVMLDRFVDGTVARISPEAPIPVLSVSGERTALGGAANVARNIAALGARCVLVGAVGRDREADELAAKLGDLPGVTAHLVTCPDRPTAVKTRFVAGRAQLLRADWEIVGPLPTAAAEAIRDHALSSLDGVGALILSDYGKGVLSEAPVAALIAAARAKGLPVIVDPKGRDYAKYRGANLVTPNRAELALASDMPTEGDAAVVAACAALTEAAGLGGVLATRSEQGMTLYRTGADGPTIDHLPARAREVFDVAGAGDTVVAALASGLAAGLGARDAALLANRAAGIVVAKVGTAVAYPGEILNDSHEERFAAAETKVATAAEAVDRVARWRKAGRRVGFTNGCFDLLHPGHISLIRQARAACDRLVVAINSDASVQRLKGESRPVQAESARAAVLASLEAVDLVTVFGEDTPLELITLPCARTCW